MTYRSLINTSDLEKFELLVKETNLLILFKQNSLTYNELKNVARNSLSDCRRQVENYLLHHPSFQKSYAPVKVKKNDSSIIGKMVKASSLVDVGPMAAGAGAIAEFVGKKLLKFCKEVIVENGGDIFLNIQKRRMVGIYAGDSPFTGGLVMEIDPEETPLGICTSSGTVGHSLSFGHADAVIVLSTSAALADAAATATGNLIKEAADIPRGIEFARGIVGLTGLVIIKGDKMGAWGQIKLSSPIEGKC